MKKPVIVGIYGESNSGKTVLIEKIVRQLTIESYRVATIKITDKKIGVDTEGKDTWRHSKAGSNLVVFSSDSETDFLLKQKLYSDEIIKIISKIDDFDIVIIEGAREKNIPKIRIGNIEKRENTIFTFDDNFDEVIKIVKNQLNM